MTSYELNQVYHMERIVAIREGTETYLCACNICHGLRTQAVYTIEQHHRRYGRDIMHSEPLLRSVHDDGDHVENNPNEPEIIPPDEAFRDAGDMEYTDEPILNTSVNFEQMAENFFARVDEIHDDIQNVDDEVIDFDDLSSNKDEEDNTTEVESILHSATQPLYPGSRTSCLRSSVILMSLCTLLSVSHHCLDELLSFFEDDVLPPGNKCPRNSYALKAMLMKLGLSHQTIHCCECDKILYWKENSHLQSCPKCQKLRFKVGSKIVPVRVLRYFSLVKRLRRLYRCPEIARHMR